ncbi:MAG: hypothetical protein K9G26_03955 [Emcibacter sp.]|nr:hypothetical protein [Emcibacter sp.]
MNKNTNRLKLFLPKILFSTVVMMSSISHGEANDSQATNKSFAYIGGTASTSLNSQNSSKFGLGIDALYMRKIWGGFAVGINMNYTFGLASTKDLYSGLADITGKSKHTSNMYSAAIVLGGISDHDNGGRLAYFIGPMIGRRDINSQYTWDETSQEFGIFNSKNSSHINLIGLTAGTYYKLPNTGWTAGINANVNLGSKSYDEFEANSQISLTIGYTF